MPTTVRMLNQNGNRVIAEPAQERSFPIVMVTVRKPAPGKVCIRLNSGLNAGQSFYRAFTNNQRHGRFSAPFMPTVWQIRRSVATDGGEKLRVIRGGQRDYSRRRPDGRRTPKAEPSKVSTKT
jgi:hypothetical protein